MTEQIQAYAKINLYLDIKSKRNDGYHNVETVMQSVSLCDSISVTLTDDGEFFVQCDVADVPTGDKNIAVRAARLFLERASLENGVSIKIEKHIPMAAGLAGGSTDAAAVLVALNRLCDNLFSYEELCEMASMLGSDVAFCISGGCSYSEGRGEVLTSLLPIPSDTVFVIACGGEGVSTPWAYELMDRAYNDFEAYKPRGVERFKTALSSDEPKNFSNEIFNIFEEPVMAARPQVSKMKGLMLKNGARVTMMSGSGPSVFGIFDNYKHAEDARAALEGCGYFACVCKPTAKADIKK